LYLEEAERIARDQNLSQELANIKLSIATYHRDNQKNNSYAIELIENLISELNPDDYYNEILSAYGELAITYEILNDYDGIIKARSRLLSLAKQKDDLKANIEANVGIAIQQFRFEKIEIALETMQYFKSINPSNYDFRLKIQLFYA